VAAPYTRATSCLITGRARCSQQGGVPSDAAPPLQVLFIFVQHPYDVGDVLSIDGEVGRAGGAAGLPSAALLGGCWRCCLRLVHLSSLLPTGLARPRRTAPQHYRVKKIGLAYTELIRIATGGQRAGLGLATVAQGPARGAGNAPAPSTLCWCLLRIPACLGSLPGPPGSQLGQALQEVIRPSPPGALAPGPGCRSLQLAALRRHPCSSAAPSARRCRRAQLLPLLAAHAHEHHQRQPLGLQERQRQVPCRHRHRGLPAGKCGPCRLAGRLGACLPGWRCAAAGCGLGVLSIQGPSPGRAATRRMSGARLSWCSEGLRCLLERCICRAAAAAAAA
jgi:hypothetical protein